MLGQRRRGWINIETTFVHCLLFANLPIARQYWNVNVNMNMNMNIALRRFLHNHGNIATERSPKPGLCPTLISNDLKGSL